MNYWNMSRESLCKYADSCEYFTKNRTARATEEIIIRNVFCRSSKNGWYDCKRYQLYEKGLKFNENIVPKDKRTLQSIEKEINK